MKRIFSSVVLLSIVLLITGCATSPSMYSNPQSYGSGGENRLVIKRADIRIDFQGVNQIEPKIIDIVNEKKGFVVSSSINSEYSYEAIIKVPADALTESLNQISNLGDETYRNVMTTDVTDQYHDNEAELKNLISLRDRMRSLLDKAKEVKEILEVEEQLTRVQIRIDKIQGSQNALDDRIVYSTISISADEKRVYGPLGYLVVGVWWVIEKLFIIK